MAQPELSGLDDFDAVVRCYRKQLFKFVLYSVRDREIAETLTQECFFKAYLARHGFRGDAIGDSQVGRNEAEYRKDTSISGIEDGS